jgi:DMSO reductase family type II enzyme chaperone
MDTTLEPSPGLKAFDWDQIDLYRFFVFAFGPPTAERHRWFSQARVSAALAGLWQKLSPEDAFPGFEWFPDDVSYEAAYIATFDVGVPEPPVPLFESGHDKSRPAQELVLENTYFYDVLGLRVDPALSVPDHLLTQLEFLSAVAYARDQACEESQRRDLVRLEHDFLQRHLLSWICTAEEKLRDCPFPAFRVLFSLMTRLLRRRHQVSSA